MPYKNLELELESLLSQVVERGASDLHIISGHPPILRIDSDLRTLEDKSPLTRDEVEKIIQIMLDEKRLAVFHEKRDLDFSYSFRDQDRFRVNAYYQMGSIALALRFIPRTIRSLEQLNLPPSLAEFAERKQGLVLMVGPTGHGKSTALAALLEHININRTEHIITIEDPIEYLFTPQKSIIQQREVGSDTITFSGAIRATLREDANVVMIGEMRDPESIATAITVAETGHLVFATLHTNDALQSIDRIIDSFPASQQQQMRAQLASILSGVVSLRLIKKIGGGRLPAAEILKVNEAARNIIREGKTYELVNVIQTGAGEGMVAIDQSLAQLVSSNQARLEDVRPYVQYEDIFESHLRKSNINMMGA